MLKIARVCELGSVRSGVKWGGREILDKGIASIAVLGDEFYGGWRGGSMGEDLAERGASKTSLGVRREDFCYRFIAAGLYGIYKAWEKVSFVIFSGEASYFCFYFLARGGDR